MSEELVVGIDLGTTNSEIAAFHEEVRLRGSEIPEVRWLDGNVGYVRITRFLDAPPTAEKMAAAVGMLADTSALIIDVRGAPGGDGASQRGGGAEHGREPRKSHHEGEDAGQGQALAEQQPACQRAPHGRHVEQQDGVDDIGHHQADGVERKRRSQQQAIDHQ